MTKLICPECGHSENEHNDDGCMTSLCECMVALSSFDDMRPLFVKLAALEAAGDKMADAIKAQELHLYNDDALEALVAWRKAKEELSK